MIRYQDGRVAEWLKALVLKTSRRASVSWVRIPPCPPLLLNPETPNLRTDLVYVRAYMSALLHQPRQEERQAGDQHDQRNSNDVGRNEGQHAPEYLG